MAVSVGGNKATPDVPIQLFAIQEATADISQKLVALMGQFKGPDDVAPSDMKITGKCGFGHLDVNTYNALMFGETITTGLTVSVPIPGIQTTIGATVTPTVPNTGTWIKDGGVFYSATGQPLKRVASSPSTGQYAVSTGTYTFNTAEPAVAAQFYFVYTEAAGQTLTVTNRLQGYGPVFELYLSMPYSQFQGLTTNQNGLHIYQARFSKTSFPLKRDAYVLSDFEFEAYPNAAGNWFDFFEADSF